MKSSIIVILVIGFVFMTGCLSPDEKAIQQDILKIAEQIELPPVSYDARTGRPLEPHKIQCQLTRYSETTGEPIYEVSVIYGRPVLPTFWTHKVYLLGYPVCRDYELENPDYTSEDINLLWYETEVTLKELQYNINDLEWVRQ